MLTPPFDVALSSIFFNLSSKHHSGLPSIKCSNTLNVYSKDFHFKSPIGCVIFFAVSNKILRINWRLTVNLQLNPNVKTIMSGHGNIRSYLHRLKIMDSPECPCKKDVQTIDHLIFQCEKLKYERGILQNSVLSPLNPELNPICYLLALLGAHHFLHVSRIRVKLLTFRLLMFYIYGAPILDVSRSHTTTQHSR